MDLPGAETSLTSVLLFFGGGDGGGNGERAGGWGKGGRVCVWWGVVGRMLLCRGNPLSNAIIDKVETLSSPPLSS